MQSNSHRICRIEGWRAYQCATECTSFGWQVTKSRMSWLMSLSTIQMVVSESCIAVDPHTIKELLRKEQSVCRKRYWQQFKGMLQTKLLMLDYNLTRFKNQLKSAQLNSGNLWYFTLDTSDSRSPRLTWVYPLMQTTSFVTWRRKLPNI